MDGVEQIYNKPSLVIAWRRLVADKQMSSERDLLGQEKFKEMIIKIINKLDEFTVNVIFFIIYLEDFHSD